MMWELLIVAALLIIIMLAQGKIDGNKFVRDNEKLFLLLKEDDYDFLVMAKYGEGVDAKLLFEKRIKDALVILVGVFFFMLMMTKKLSFLNLIICFAVAYFIYKSAYSNLKAYYKKHLHEIDLLLPYYLKSLEILIQHYTVPVALSKSIDTAPSIFREGLRELTGKINAGDSSIDPYMDFAIKYPVRDSMRMMRLLYRLGLGDQERKQEQLIVFSRTISNLQAKSRETKYKERLERMEKKTMVMLSTTGVGVMLVLLLSILRTFTNM